ncbi:MAG: hypothetical protein QM645_07460 [Asticcacaulis sp.]
MNKIIRVLAACSLMSATPLAVLAHDFTPAPVKGENQRIRYERGLATTFSELPQSTVSIKVLPVTDFKEGNITLSVSVLNLSADEILFEPELITASLPKKKDKVTIISAAEMEKKARNDAKWARRTGYLTGIADVAVKSTAMVAGAESDNAAKTLKNVTNAPGMVIGGLTGQGSSARVNAELEESLDTIRNQVLLKSTIDPETVYGGLLFLQAPKLGKKDDRTLTLKVVVGDETHLFRFRLDDYNS